ncbi:hypothetical protein FMN50_11025 [Rhodobacterales bacterium]|nr:hypothetical protein FMN50_11025 [Rhodobacterales bacterium]
MAARPQSTAIRRAKRDPAPLRVAAGGCLLGIAITTAGFVLADHQDRMLSAGRTVASEERSVLINAVNKAALTAPRLRLEELAAMPLVTEFIALAENQPQSTDARELRAYLKNVLAAATEETGLARIALETADGTELIASSNPVADTTGSKGLFVEAPLAADAGFPRTTGRLTGEVPHGRFEILPPPGADGTTMTGSTGTEQTSAGAFFQEDIPAGTRLLSGLAGLCVALFGGVAAVLLHRRSAATH